MLLLSLTSSLAGHRHRTRRACLVLVARSVDARPSNSRLRLAQLSVPFNRPDCRRILALTRHATSSSRPLVRLTTSYANRLRRVVRRSCNSRTAIRRSERLGDATGRGVRAVWRIKRRNGWATMMFASSLAFRIPSRCTALLHETSSHALRVTRTAKAQVQLRKVRFNERGRSSGSTTLVPRNLLRCEAHRQRVKICSQNLVLQQSCESRLSREPGT